MTTIADRLNIVADMLAEGNQPRLPAEPAAIQNAAMECRAIATELESAPAADAVHTPGVMAMPIRGWRRKSVLPECDDVFTTYPEEAQQWGDQAHVVVDYADHLSAIAALQQKHESQLQSFEKTTDGWMRAAIKARDEVAALQTQIAELEARQVPDGWVAVPRDPTPEMIEEGRRAHWSKEMDQMSPAPTEFHDECGGPIGYAWIAMLAAAPSNPTTQPPEGR